MGKGNTKDFIISVVISFLLYLIPMGSIFFTFPLLLLNKRCPKRLTDTACVAVLVLVLARDLFLVRASLGSSLTWALLMVSLFIPVSLILSAVVWVNSEDKDAVKRLMLSMLPSIAMFFAIGLWFLLSPDTAAAVVEAFKATYSALVSQLLDFSPEFMDAVFSILVELTLSLALCMVFVNVAVVTFLAEAASHRFDSGFDERISLFKLPDNLIYAFLASWALILVKRFVDFPFSASLVVNNACFVITAFYALQGFAIAYFNLRKRRRSLASTRFFAFLFIFTLFLPVVNIIICLGMPLLGVAETWLNLRKRDEGVFINENYS